MGGDLHRRRAEDRSVSLRGRLLQMVLALGVALAGAGAVLGATVLQLRSAENQVQHRLLPAVADSNRLLSLFVDQQTGVRGLVITGNPEFLEPYDLATAQLPPVISNLRRDAAGLAGAMVSIDAVLNAHQLWLDRAALPEISAARQGNVVQAQKVVAAGEAKQLFDVLRARTDELQRLLNQDLAVNSQSVHALNARLAWLLASTLGLFAVLLALMYPALLRLVVKPMQRLAFAARQSGLNLSVPVAVQGPREVVSTARDVEGMRRVLVEQVNLARQANEALAQRGPAVLALRAALAPQPVTVPGLAVASRLDPAEGFLAGDWFDAVELDDGRLALVLGDVAGHGPGPAVFALRLKHLLAAALVAGRMPGEALTVTARQVGDTGELFATVFVAVVDPAQQRLKYANAGHPAALLFNRPDGHSERRQPGERRQLPYVADPVMSTQKAPQAKAVDRRQSGHLELAATGPLLSSLVSSWSWGTVSHRFHAGDLLLAYTDGLVEARSPAGRQYGPDRLLQVVQMNSTHDLDDLIAEVIADVGVHTGGRATDDTTVMACRLTASGDGA